MKILAIGQNYAEQQLDKNSTNILEPVVFMKPDTALLKNNKPFYIPDFSTEIQYETELIIKINRIGKNITPKFAERYYTEITLGIDFTAHDIQRKLKTEGKPWEIAKSFDNSAVIGNFIQMSELADNKHIYFRLDINGNTVQNGNSADMILPFNELISYVSRFFTLKIGDILFTGSTKDVGKVAIGDRLEGYIFDQKMFDFKIK